MEGGGAGGQGSDRRGLALQQVLVDVVGVALEPGGVQENVLAALLYRALCCRRVVALEEALHLSGHFVDCKPIHSELDEP